nr:hypothetical protein CFP56_28803 [Quercus suber]
MLLALLEFEAMRSAVKRAAEIVDCLARQAMFHGSRRVDIASWSLLTASEENIRRFVSKSNDYCFSACLQSGFTTKAYRTSRPRRRTTTNVDQVVALIRYLGAGLSVFIACAIADQFCAEPVRNSSKESRFQFQVGPHNVARRSQCIRSGRRTRRALLWRTDVMNGLEKISAPGWSMQVAGDESRGVAREE